MEQLAKQRERFIKASKNYTDQDGGPSGSSKLDEPGTSKDGAGGSSSGSPHKSSPNKRAAAEDQDQSQDKTSTSRTSISEYTCCICQFQTEATENRPIGLVTLIQSSSVLAHKHESHNHLGMYWFLMLKTMFILVYIEKQGKERRKEFWNSRAGKFKITYISLNLPPLDFLAG